MEEKLFCACCPVCGHLLFKGSEIEKVELYCSECIEVIEVKMQDDYIELRNIQSAKVALA